MANHVILVLISMISSWLIFSIAAPQNSSTTAISSVTNNTEDLTNSTTDNETQSNSSSTPSSADFRGYVYNSPGNGYLPPNNGYLPPSQQGQNAYNDDVNNQHSNSGQTNPNGQNYNPNHSGQNYNPNNQGSNDYDLYNNNHGQQDQTHGQDYQQNQGYQQHQQDQGYQQHQQDQGYQQQQQNQDYQQHQQNPQQQYQYRKKRAEVEKTTIKPASRSKSVSSQNPNHPSHINRSKRQDDFYYATTTTTESSTTDYVYPHPPGFVAFELDIYDRSYRNDSSSQKPTKNSTPSDNTDRIKRQATHVDQHLNNTGNKQDNSNSTSKGFYLINTQIFEIDTVDVYYDDADNNTSNDTNDADDTDNAYLEDELFNPNVILIAIFNSGNETAINGTTNSYSTSDTSSASSTTEFIHREARQVSATAHNLNNITITVNRNSTGTPVSNSNTTRTTMSSTDANSSSSSNNIGGRSGFDNQQDVSSNSDSENYFRFQSPDSYAYRYEVNDESTGDVKGAYQKLEGNVTVGSYHVLLPDGRHLYVDYIADVNGYVANVTYVDSNSTDTRQANGTQHQSTTLHY